MATTKTPGKIAKTTKVPKTPKAHKATEPVESDKFVPSVDSEAPAASPETGTPSAPVATRAGRSPRKVAAVLVQTANVPAPARPATPTTPAPARYTGFGAPDKFGAHVFKVVVPAGRAGEVVLSEEYGYLEGQGGLPSHEVRVRLDRSLWTPIAEATRRDFNPRLREKKVAVGTWRPGDNLIDRLLGKELAVLMWAAEHASADQIQTICSRWAALRPEERWWLYAMTAAEAGAADDTDRGWRRALFEALSDAGAREGSQVRQRRIREMGTGGSLGSLGGNRQMSLEFLAAA